MASDTPLRKMILQPRTEQVSISDGTATYTETWKGPWESIRLLSGTQKVMGTTLIVGQKRPNFNNGNWSSEFNPPSTPSELKMPWVISSLQIQQEGSGQSGILTIQYACKQPTVENANPDGGTEPETPTDDNYQVELEEQKRWSIDWHTYNRSVLEYSTDPNGIIYYKNARAAKPWTYKLDVDGTNTVEITDTKERQIATYYAKNVSPQFHYPTVTLHQEYTLPIDKPVYTDIGKDLDKIQQLPDSCPFKSKLTNWHWIMVADRGSIIRTDKETITTSEQEGEPVTEVVQQLRYSRDTTWQGAYHWDENFYGSNAWQPITNRSN